MSWILFAGISFAQPKKSDTVYCAPISDTRIIYEQAAKFQLTDSMLNQTGAKLVILQSKYESQTIICNDQISVEKDRTKAAEAQTAIQIKIGETWHKQADDSAATAKTMKRERNFAIAGWIGTIIVILAVVL
jgi:hypothetical protein